MLSVNLVRTANPNVSVLICVHKIFWTDLNLCSLVDSGPHFKKWGSFQSSESKTFGWKLVSTVGLAWDICCLDLWSGCICICLPALHFYGCSQLDKQCLILKYTNELAMDSFAYQHWHWTSGLAPRPPGVWCGVSEQDSIQSRLKASRQTCRIPLTQSRLIQGDPASVEHRWAFFTFTAQTAAISWN